MTYENLAPPSQVQEKTYQLPGNGQTSVLVLTSSRHKHGTVIYILSAASSNWTCPMLRIVSKSSLLICNFFYLGTSIPSAVFVTWYDLYFTGWNSFVTLFICTLHKAHTHISLWEVYFVCKLTAVLDSSWNVTAHGDAQEVKWRGNWQMEWVASTLHTTSERGVSSITTADAQNSAASSRLNWRPRRFKWTRPFRRKTKSVFCACAITFQTQSTTEQIVIKFCFENV